MFLRWNSTLAAQPNEVPIITLPGGDLGLSPENFALVVADPSIELRCDPSDAVAKAVIDAVRFNVEQELARVNNGN